MPPRAGVELTLDKKRVLRVTWRSLEALESQHHMTLDELGNELASGDRTKAITTTIWLGLLHEEPDLTMEQARDLLDQGEVMEIIEASMELVDRHFGGHEAGNGSGPAGGPKKSPRSRKKAGRKATGKKPKGPTKG